MSVKRADGLPVQFIITHGDTWTVDVEAGRRTHSLGSFDSLTMAVARVETWAADRGLELQPVVLLDARRRYQQQRRR